MYVAAIVVAIAVLVYVGIQVYKMVKKTKT
jgi:uncharacterized protein YoxC